MNAGADEVERFVLQFVGRRHGHGAGPQVTIPARVRRMIALP